MRNENLPQVFSFEGNGINILTINNESWWIAKEVCDALGIKNHRDAVKRLDDDEKDAVGISDSMGRVQQTSVINESGLYNLINTSTRPEAKKFKRWVNHDVIPTIRRTGSYGAQQNQSVDFNALIIENKNLTADVIELLKEKNARLEAQLAEVKENMPKRKKWSRAEKMEVLKLYKSGVSCIIIGEKYGVTSSAIESILRYARIKRSA